MERLLGTRVSDLTQSKIVVAMLSLDNLIVSAPLAMLPTRSMREMAIYRQLAQHLPESLIPCEFAATRSFGSGSERIASHLFRIKSAIVAAALQKLFVGSNGIRAGWRFLIFVVLVVVFRVAAFRIPPVWRLLETTESGTLTPFSDGTAATISAITAFLAAFIMSRIEKRRISSYGIPLTGAFGRLFWHGVIWGLGMLTLEMLIIHALGGFDLSGFALHGATLVRYAVAWSVNFVLVGINEEFTFRGYPQFTLTTGIRFWPTAVLLSAVFGLVHLKNPNEGWVGALSVFLFGMFACLTLKRTGNLWFAIGFHAAADYAETFIYSVPDSGYTATGHLLNSNLRPGPGWLTGGIVGPEGSVFAFVLLGFAFCLFAWLYPGQRSDKAGTNGIKP